MARSPLVAAIYRLPLQLHRLGIRGYERILGIDWLVLTTRGRRTGRERCVMLDVVGHEPDTDTWYVQPADGHNSQWLKNVLADPRPTVEVHDRTFQASATDITGPQGAEVVLRFIRDHPRYARLIVWLVGYVDSIDHPDDELRTRLRDVPVVALRAWPASGPGGAAPSDYRGANAAPPGPLAGHSPRPRQP